MIGSLGRSAGEEDRDCMQERNLRNGSLLSTSFATDGLTPATMHASPDAPTLPIRL